MSPLPVFHVHLTGPRRIRAAGFTLVELLVAVAVFALLATASVTLLAHVLDQRAVVSAQSARLAQLQRTHALLGAEAHAQAAHGEHQLVLTRGSSIM